MSKWLSLLIFAFYVVFPIVPAYAVTLQSTNKHVVIESIKTDGSGSSKEFVRIRNLGLTAVNVANWVIEYSEAQPLANYETCATSDWVTVSKRREVLADALILPGEAYSVYVGSMLDDKPGVARLVQYTESNETVNMVVHDVVGWGDEFNRPYCAERAPASIPRNNQIITRCVDQMGSLVDADDNATDFFVVAESAVGPIPCPDEGTAEPENPDVELECGKVVVSEILPNPSGSDTGKEFIELHNPTTKAIELEGCSLGLDGLSKTYSFTNGAVLEANEYQAYYDDETGLTLPNSAGGNVLIIEGQTEYGYSYPGNLKDDISWATFGNLWQQTNNITPGEGNKQMTALMGPGDEEVIAPCPDGKYRSPETNRCRTLEIASALKPCDEGKERNPDTNRCRSIIGTLSSLIPCKEGQERSPVTNRCKAVLSASTRLVACKQGQERNPETNRCRKADTESTSLKPCPEGQERNPDTNRCRKTAAALAAATIEDKNGDKKNLINYSILGLVGASAVGYGAYEYRNDFRSKIMNIKSRFLPPKSGL